MKHRARLTSADAFLLVLERMMASAGQGMHLGLTVLRLGPGFDLERFRAAVERAAAACPFGQAQIGQRFGGVLHWRWEDGARANFPIQTHREGEIDEAELSRRRLNEPLATGVAFDVILSESGCTVLMTCGICCSTAKGRNCCSRRSAAWRKIRKRRPWRVRGTARSES